jgi:hypothetical protein
MGLKLFSLLRREWSPTAGFICRGRWMQTAFGGKLLMLRLFGWR